jgi:PhoD-like phosphatase
MTVVQTTAEADLVLGPLLRWVGDSGATVWVETDAACEVEVLGSRARTFAVEGHHYALVVVEGLPRGASTPYEVRLDGRVRWPPGDGGVPPSVIRTLEDGAPLRLAFGSCRVAVPHVPPYTLSKDDDPRGKERDALHALALRMMREPAERRPDCLLVLGDQVYADEGSPGAREFFRGRRDTSQPPGLEAADFEEYTRLYWESWRDPVLRWLLSTVPSAMIFDDHEVHDDWNTSQAWLEEIRRQSWWQKRIVGALMSYWVYQHLGNLSPSDLAEDDVWRRVRDSGDAGPLLRELARGWARTTDGSQWSYHRDFGRTRLLMIDSRGGRILEEGSRRMVDADEWRWLDERARGDVDHLLIGTSLPAFLAPGMQRFESWNEAVCGGAWGSAAARLGERIRRGIDLEHWAAFRSSFEDLVELVRAVGAGERGAPPATIGILSGDVHHAYLADVAYRARDRVASRVYQAVCSPVRNPLDAWERRVVRFGASRAGAVVGKVLAAAARVPRPPVRWRLAHEPLFDNQVATLELEDRRSLLRIEKVGADGEEPELTTSLEERLS